MEEHSLAAEETAWILLSSFHLSAPFSQEVSIPDIKVLFRVSVLMTHTNMQIFFFFLLYNCAMYSFKPTEMLSLSSGIGGNKAGKSRHTRCHPLDKFTDELKFHPCDCQCLVGPWVTEKKSCPQGYVCILEHRWNSIGNVLSAVVLSCIYTLSSFDFWDVAAVSLLIPSFLYWEQLCKWISDLIVKKKKH